MSLKSYRIAASSTTYLSLLQINIYLPTYTEQDLIYFTRGDEMNLSTSTCPGDLDPETQKAGHHPNATTVRRENPRRRGSLTYTTTHPHVIIILPSQERQAGDFMYTAVLRHRFLVISLPRSTHGPPHLLLRPHALATPPPPPLPIGPGAKGRDRVRC